MIKQQNRKYGNTQEQLIGKLEKLKNIIYIINSNLEEFDKAYHLYRLYNGAGKFRSSYILIYKNGRYDEMFKEYINKFEEIYQIYLKYENMGYFDVSKIISKIEVYLVNYKDAKNVINKFMCLEYNYDFDKFLEEIGITKKEFDFYVKTIGILNPDLLEQYEKKRQDNKLNRYLNNVEICRSVAHGIRTGYLLDGTKFDVLEYWKLMPFKNKKGIMAEFLECREFIPDIVYSPTWANRIYNFAKLALPEDAATIYEFAVCNNLWQSTQATELDLKHLFGSITSVNKVVIDDNGNEFVDIVNFDTNVFNNIISYMKSNKIPLMVETFKLILIRYVNGEIIIDSKTLKRKK